MTPPGPYSMTSPAPYSTPSNGFHLSSPGYTQFLEHQARSLTGLPSVATDERKMSLSEPPLLPPGLRWISSDDFPSSLLDDRHPGLVEPPVAPADYQRAENLSVLDRIGQPEPPPQQPLARRELRPSELPSLPHAWMIPAELKRARSDHRPVSIDEPSPSPLDDRNFGLAGSSWAPAATSKPRHMSLLEPPVAPPDCRQFALNSCIGASEFVYDQQQLSEHMEGRSTLLQRWLNASDHLPKRHAMNDPRGRSEPPSLLQDWLLPTEKSRTLPGDRPINLLELASPNDRDLSLFPPADPYCMRPMENPSTTTPNNRRRRRSEPSRSQHDHHLEPSLYTDDVSALGKHKLGDTLQGCDSNEDGNLNKIKLGQFVCQDPKLASVLGLPTHTRQDDGTRASMERLLKKFGGDDTIPWSELYNALHSGAAPTSDVSIDVGALPQASATVRKPDSESAPLEHMSAAKASPSTAASGKGGAATFDAYSTLSSGSCGSDAYTSTDLENLKSAKLSKDKGDTLEQADSVKMALAAAMEEANAAVKKVASAQRALEAAEAGTAKLEADAKTSVDEAARNNAADRAMTAEKSQVDYRRISQHELDTENLARKQQKEALEQVSSRFQYSATIDGRHTQQSELCAMSTALQHEKEVLTLHFRGITNAENKQSFQHELGAMKVGLQQQDDLLESVHKIDLESSRMADCTLKLQQELGLMKAALQQQNEALEIRMKQRMPEVHQRAMARLGWWSDVP